MTQQVLNADLDQLVKEADLGGREPVGAVGAGLAMVAAAWSLFQLWYASPLPFMLGFGIFNDTEARAIHLAFAVFLAFCAYPAFKGSSRQVVPLSDWLLAAVGAFCAAYLFLFYNALATRPGQPTAMDIAVGLLGVAIMLEATRRAMGLGMLITTGVFIAFVFAGPHMPDVIQHRGVSLQRFISHMWLTTEGVYGVALGVSVQFIFLFVLFGTLLDIAGAGNFMLQMSLALLGHLRGGPAKEAVVSSSLNGVVSGGIFTIPLMKKSGYGGVKAGAIETMSSVDGQIMPPVMGAAAFLMVEYVGIPYSEIIKHALLPALLSYFGLFYIVHLEALKLNMQPIVRREPRPLRDKFLRFGLGVSGSILVVAALYYLLAAVKALLGDAAAYAIGAIMLVLYLGSVRAAARCPDLPQDIDVDNPKALDTWPTVLAGLHFLLPIGTLIWCLMVEEMSPSLSAFWAIVVLVLLMATQRWLIEFFRGQPTAGTLRGGAVEVVHGLNDGARNMIGIGVATATAGIIVGGITLTGVGLRMIEFVELVSQGNVMAMLLFIAFVCLVLGLGVPTTANYVLVATLMAPVVVELGARSGLVIPLIAVHLFVFYYGIMGDITPPVGLATFAAAAISGEDAIQTGIQGSIYALRTVILPFIWIFNPQLLLIDVHSTGELIRVVTASILATLIFAAVTMQWFRVKSRLWETALLAAAVVLLFRPDFFMDRITPPTREAPAVQVFELAKSADSDATLAMLIKGTTLEGDEVVKTVALQLGEAGADGRKRLADAGLQLVPLGDTVQVGSVKFGSRAKRGGFEPGWDVAAVQVPTGAPSPHWFYLPALLLVGLVWWNQGRRLGPGLH